MNLCSYCAIQTAHENARMLALDALDGAPELVAILGTRTPTDDPRPFYRGREQVMKALRRRWCCEYASQAEFTTGKGRLSGGLRRPHWNLLLKGIPAEDVDQARELVQRIWCQHVDALPEYQYVEALQSAAAFMTYVAMHFQKQSQAPPAGWTGQRFNASREYFNGRTRAEARDAAKKSLRIERETWKAAKLGLVGDELHAHVDAAIAAAESETWTLFRQSLKLDSERWAGTTSTLPAPIREAVLCPSST